jgi:hypothetical protein
MTEWSEEIRQVSMSAMQWLLSQQSTGTRSSQASRVRPV